MPYDRILDLMSLREAPNLYLLGLFAKRLTIYSQQIRAVNLIEAIHWYRQPLPDSNLAIVGGGVAGVTAAAMALKHGARVTLIERLQNILEIQLKSDRWLHPTLYDWPLSGLAPGDDSTRLPVMNWKAATAKHMAETLVEEWTKCCSTVIPHFNSEVVNIESGVGGNKIKLRWRSTIDEVRGEESQFDQVIFAVGFGLEPKGVNRRSYWENDSLDQTLRTDECVLIAGYGDGALTDLMRACLKEFDHGNLLTSVAKAVNGKDLDNVKEIEGTITTAKDLSNAYRQLKIPAIQDFLRTKLNRGRRVILSGPGPHLFDPRASALNRLIASQLLHLDAFDHVPIGKTKKIDPADAKDNSVFVKLQRKVKRPFTDIVLRFGVDRTITKVQGVEDVAKRLQTDWEKIQPHDDPTRIRLWDRFTPISEDIDHSCVLFLSPASRDVFLKEVAERSVKDVNLPQISNLKTASVMDCLRSNESLSHTVRALCRAPVAIFALGPDMGKKNIGGMLLLGIRSAVRRGPTLVVHEGKLTPAEWGSLPFTLKELQIYDLDKNKWPESASQLAAAMREGLTVLGMDAHGYHDMPVFDIVRRPVRRTENPPGGEREVFTLCSFAESYKDSWEKLKVWLNGTHDHERNKLSLKRVIDYSSPLLVGERLYELIRHAESCLVDWTDWSPNVFFEMGVRLAVAPIPPICVLRYDGLELDGIPKALHDRFDPVIYDEVGDTSEIFREKFLKRLGALKPNDHSVYSVAEQNLSLDDEYGGRSTYEQLFTVAKAMFGADPVNLKLLYGKNMRLKLQVLLSGADALLAAKLLIDRKLDRNQGTSDSKTLEDLRQQIDSLLSEVERLIKSSKKAVSL